MRTRIRWLLFLVLTATLVWSATPSTVEARGHARGGHRGGHHRAHGRHSRGQRGAHHRGARGRRGARVRRGAHRGARRGARAARRGTRRAGFRHGFAHRGAWGVHRGAWRANRFVTNRTVNRTFNTVNTTRNVNVRRGVGWYGTGRGYWGWRGGYAWPAQYNLYAYPADVTLNPWGDLTSQYMDQLRSAQAATVRGQ